MRNTFTQTGPAAGYAERWRDATPLGNGKTGVLLYGGITNEKLVIGRYDLWHMGRDGEIPEVADTIREMRDLEAAGDLESACSVMSDRMESLRYQTTEANPRTLAQIEIKSDLQGTYRKYRRTLKADAGYATVGYCVGDAVAERTAFVSRAKDVIVYHWANSVPENLQISAGFFASGEPHCGAQQTKDAATAERKILDGCVCYSVQNDDRKFFGVVLRVISADVTLSAGKITVRRSTCATVLAKAFSCADDRDAAEKECAAFLNGIKEDFAQLRGEHEKLHAEIYQGADIVLYDDAGSHHNSELLELAKDEKCTPELAEKLWRFGRYLFISGTCEDGLPFPQYGLWAAGYYRIWSQNVANENVQMIYWHTVCGGLGDFIKPLIHYYCRNIDKYKTIARKMYGCSGIFVSTYSTPVNCAPMPAVPVILHFCGVAGWLCRHFYEYYLATGDEELLTDEILPFMLETASFYEDYLTVGKDGTYEIYPSVSPENTPLNYMNVRRPTVTGHPMPVAKNATVEFAIVKELLSNLLAIAERHPELAGKADTWKEMLRRIPAYRINRDGAVAEWMDEKAEDNYHHRHLSQIYPLFPGNEILCGKENEALLPNFQKAVELRKLGSMTGWSLVHMAAVYARLSAPEKAFEALNNFTKVCLLDNFFTLHNDYRGMGITVTDMGDEFFAPVQLDALMGAVNAVQEMIVTVLPGVIRLLPACPAEFGVGSARNLHFFGGTIDMDWDLSGSGVNVKIIAIKNGSIRIVPPFGQEEFTVESEAGKEYRFRFSNR